MSFALAFAVFCIILKGMQTIAGTPSCHATADGMVKVVVASKKCPEDWLYCLCFLGRIKSIMPDTRIVAPAKQNPAS